MRLKSAHGASCSCVRVPLRLPLMTRHAVALTLAQLLGYASLVHVRPIAALRCNRGAVSTTPPKAWRRTSTVDRSSVHRVHQRRHTVHQALQAAPSGGQVLGHGLQGQRATGLRAVRAMCATTASCARTPTSHDQHNGNNHLHHVTHHHVCERLAGAARASGGGGGGHGAEPGLTMLLVAVGYVLASPAPARGAAARKPGSPVTQPTGVQALPTALSCGWSRSCERLVKLTSLCPWLSAVSCC